MAKEKTRLNCNLDNDVYDRLKLYAEENHITMTTAITQWILKLKVKGDTQVRGQLKL